MINTLSIRSLLTPVGLLACLFVVSGCASMRSDDNGLPPVAPTASLPDGSVRGDTRNQQIARLWSAAEQSRRDNNDAKALEHLYDALEIDPRNGLLWSRAAEIQLDNLEPAQAENMALRSNMFSGDNTSLRYRNWLIIEHSRDMRGDLLGVRSAHKKVQEYQYK